MIGTIRKHQTWLWAIIITLTIISFVIFFSPYSKVANTRSGSFNAGSINGERITQEQFVNAQREILLQYFFRSGGNWLNDLEAKKQGFDLERETYQWLLLIQKQEQIGIHVSSELAARFFRDEMLPQFHRAGLTTPDLFVKQVLLPRGLQMDDLDRFVRHFLSIQELISTVGLSGKLVTPQEVKGLYEREHQELATEAVFFSASNYLAGVSATPEAVSQFYSNQMANYRLPDRVQVSFVKFAVSNFQAQAEEELMKTNLAEIIESNFQRLGTNYFRDAKTPEEVRTKIRDELIRTRALSQARAKALEFAGPLFNLDPPRAEALEELAKTNGLTVGVSQPFNREDGPKDLAAGADFTKAAFALTPEEPFARPIAGEDGVYVIALKKKLPSEVPPLDQIREQVVADYRYNEGATLARQAGKEFYQALTNGLAQGKAFSTVCADAKVKPVELPPFSLSTRTLPEVEDHINLNALKQLAFSTPPGKVSNLELTREGCLVLEVKSRLPIDAAKMNADLPAFANSVRQARQNEAFYEWFRKEADKGLRDTPLARPATPALPSGARKP